MHATLPLTISGEVAFTNHDVGLPSLGDNNFQFLLAEFLIFTIIFVLFVCVQTQNFGCKLLSRSFGAVWAVNSPPSGPLSVRMLFSSDDDGEDTWIVPLNNIPQDWKAGESYDSGVQVNQ